MGRCFRVPAAHGGRVGSWVHGIRRRHASIARSSAGALDAVGWRPVARTASNAGETWSRRGGRPTDLACRVGTGDPCSTGPTHSPPNGFLVIDRCLEHVSSKDKSRHDLEASNRKPSRVICLIDSKTPNPCSTSRYITRHHDQYVAKTPIRIAGIRGILTSTFAASKNKNGTTGTI